ncbi:MAG: deoxyribose-phosphate aldolase [Bacillota bacterium]
MDIEEVIARITQEVLVRIQTGQAVAEAEKYAAETGLNDPGADVAYAVENSILDPDATADKIIKACKDTKECRMVSICVSPYYVPLAVEELRNSGVKVCVAIGFPQGAVSTAAKVTEAKEAIRNGAEEIDVTMNVLAIKNGAISEAVRDLKEVVDVARGKAIVKAIYEQSIYSDAEKLAALNVAKSAGADFVKISNALTGKNAMVEDVRFVRDVLGPGIGIKIDGNITTAKTAKELLAAGATRCGSGRAVQIIKG